MKRSAVMFIPVTMAIVYLPLFVHFKAIGGYKPVHDAAHAAPAAATGAGRATPRGEFLRNERG